jgi:hypothetical protein
MDQFFLTVLIVAAVVLILCLIGIGILMRYQHTGDSYPPHAANCPDFWVSDSNGGCKAPTPSKNTGTNNTTTLSSQMLQSDICTQRKWATSKGIIWDGVSNYNGC